MMANLTGKNVLVLPIELNTLCLESDQTVMDAKADFSRLPWSDGQRDFNADTPFLGEAVLSPPFQNKNFTMATGVHLHWVLPRAHRTYPTTTDQNGNKKEPYPAPNRWLITKDGGEQWVVESDYLDTGISKYNKNAVTIPVFNATNLDPLHPPGLGVTQNPQPYRYLGRQVPMANWPVNDSPKYWSDDHGQELSAFGYGEMAFNTFYPNCRSAFGFFDPTPGTSYEVLGWYSEGESDIVKKAVVELNALIDSPADYPHLLRKVFDDDGSCPTWLSDLITNEASNAAWNGHKITTKNCQHLHALLVETDPAKPVALNTLLNIDDTYKNEFMRFGIRKILNWEFTDAQTGQTGYPTQSIYYSSISVSDDNEESYTFDKVAVGNSASEALSAYLSNTLEGVAAADVGTVETQLNVILHGSNFQGNLTDAQLNFKEALHEAGFDPKQNGSLWRIRKIQLTGNHYKEDQELGQVSLPEPMANLLNELNLAQSNYDAGLNELTIAQEQLYSSWCKYMVCAYPPLGTNHDLPDEDRVKAFTEWQTDRVMVLKAQIGSFTPGETPTDSTATGINGNALLTAFKAAYDYLNVAAPGEQSINETLDTTGYAWELSQVPAPRYYKPKDPVLVFAAADDITPGEAEDSKLPLNVVWDDNLVMALTGVPIQPDALTAALPTTPGAPSFTSIATKSTPQILEWLVDYFPVINGSNLTTGSGDYASDFLGSPNLTLSPDSFDFTQNENVLDAPVAYKGSAYISTTAKTNLQEKLKNVLLGRYSSLKDEDFDNKTSLETAWSQLSNAPTEFTDPGFTAYKAYIKLIDKYILSQSIGGFNRALVQYQHNVQLPIADPLGFSDYQPFILRVATALQGIKPPASNPVNLFVPLRAGALHINQVQLVDHFGRGVSQTPVPIIASSLAMSDNPTWLWLGPRFAQEARLNFRWLAAVNELRDTDIEMNSHPATSPICGWILPNYLEDSLVFYDQNGKGLGSFQSATTAGWNAFPGDLTPIKDTDIVSSNPKGINAHLLKVMIAVLAGTDKINGASTSGFVNTLITKIKEAQKKIYPENFAGHDALSILMGKPIAIVRAMLNLEVKGDTMSDQGWIPFEQQLQGGVPQTDAYDQVVVPINLGDPHQLNDGLIGHWKESAGGDLGTDLTMITHNDIAYPIIHQTLASDPVTLTMLVDPHGIVHATSGVLPVKTIDIPPDQYTKALKNIEVAFFSASLLTPTNTVQLSVPKETGYQWSWLQQDNITMLDPGHHSNGITVTIWKHLPDLPLINANTFANAWTTLLPKLKVHPTESGTPWTELLSKNWIKAVNGSELFQVISPSDPNREALVTWAEYKTEIEALIFKNLTGMTPYNTNAQFDGQQELLDGWLLLSNQNEPKKPKG